MISSSRTVIVIVIVAAAALLPSLSLAQGPTVLGYPLTCNPALAPKTGGCGIPEFLGLFNYLIGILQIAVIPIATLVAIYAGFVILTAGGSQEKFKKGTTILTTALVGVAITLLANFAAYYACLIVGCPS